MLRLQMTIEAIDKATKVLRTINEQIEKANEPVRKLKASFASLVRESGLPKLAEHWEKVRERTMAAKDAAMGIARTWASVAGVATGFFWVLKKNIDEVDRANDLAQQIGISVEWIQKLGYAAQLSGSNQEEMADALTHLSRAMVEAKGGSQETLQWFKLLGLSQHQLSKMSVVEVWERMADTFQRVGDTGQNAAYKISLMTALTGRSGAKLKQMLDGGSDGMRKLYSEAERLGVVLDGKTAGAMADFNDNMDRLKFSIFGVMASIAQAALPAMDSLVKKVTEANVASRGELGKNLGRMFSQIIDKAPGVFSAMGELSGKLVEIANFADRVAQALGGWNVVFNILIGVGIAKFIVALVMLSSSIWTMGTALWTFSTTTAPFFLSMLAGMLAELWAIAVAVVAATWPFLLLAAAIAAVVFVVYKYWGPIKAFVMKLWDDIVGYASRKIQEWIDFVKMIWAPVEKVLKWASGPNAGAGPDAGLPETDAMGNPTGGSAFSAASRAQVGGTVRILIDSESRARPTTVTSDNPRVPLEVGYTGGNMASP
jgi:hypothetical protein